MFGSVVEMARLTGIDTQHIDAIHAVTSLLAKTLADKAGKLEIQPIR
jgi:2-dehydropantoate 2-reductase